MPYVYDGSMLKDSLWQACSPLFDDIDFKLYDLWTQTYTARNEIFCVQVMSMNVCCYFLRNLFWRRSKQAMIPSCPVFTITIHSFYWLLHIISSWYSIGINLRIITYRLINGFRVISTVAVISSLSLSLHVLNHGHFLLCSLLSYSHLMWHLKALQNVT
jgi:hypothetical protein